MSKSITRADLQERHSSTWEGAAVPTGASESAPARVLMVGADGNDAETVAATLGALSLETTWSRAGADALSAVRDQWFDALLIDMELPDISGIDMVRALRASDASAAHRVIFFAELGRPAAAVEAMQVGALGVLDKPLDARDLAVAVHSALRRHAAPPARLPVHGVSPTSLLAPAHRAAPRTPASAAERWADVMLRTLRIDRDPKTISYWCTSIAVSRTMLCECCRQLGVSPHDARDFARLMRAVWHSSERWQPEALLDLSDARTLRRLVARAKLRAEGGLTPTLDEFLERQQWIPQDNPGLLTLHALLFGDDSHDAPPASIGPQCTACD